MARRTSIATATAVVVAGIAITTPVAAEAGRLLTGRDIKDGSVTSADVANGSLGRKDFAKGALPAGERGPAGPAGPAGDQGAQGDPGDQGPSGVVSTVFQPGSVSTPKTTLAFIAAPASVAVQPGETVSVVSSVALGSSLGALHLNLDVCYDDGTSLTPVPGGGVQDLTAAAGQKLLFTLPAVIDGLSGAYSVGLCGLSSDASSWNLTGGGQTTVQVFTQP